VWKLLLIPVAVAAGLAVSFAVSDDHSAKRTLTDTNGVIVGPDTVTTTIPDGSWLGQCAVVTAPDHGDPCEVAGQILQYVFLAEVGFTAYHAKWLKDNPGEAARLNAHLQNPQCIQGTTGPIQDMKTHWGAALYAITQALACLPPDPNPQNRRPPLAINVPPPLDPKRKDKTPPTPTGPITITPSNP
jgi:hypothetical protein